MKTRPHVTQNTAGYQTHDDGAIAGKATTNNLPSFSSKNGPPTAANMTPSSPRNSARVGDVLLAAESHESHLRLVPTPHNKTSIMCHQCIHQIISHHLLIFQFHSCHHLLHLIMHLMHIQPLCQTFQLRSA